MKKQFSIKLKNEEVVVWAERIGQYLWFKYKNESYSYSLIDLNASVSKKLKSTKKNPDQILSPMPGKITKIFIKTNQQIKKGQSLLVMEAMKMEYTLKSDMDGFVDKINTELAGQVALGQLLIKLRSI